MKNYTSTINLIQAQPVNINTKNSIIKVEYHKKEVVIAKPVKEQIKRMPQVEKPPLDTKERKEAELSKKADAELQTIIAKPKKLSFWDKLKLSFKGEKAKSEIDLPTEQALPAPKDKN